MFGIELEQPNPFAWADDLGIDLRRVLQGEQSFTYQPGGDKTRDSISCPSGAVVLGYDLALLRSRPHESDPDWVDDWGLLLSTQVAIVHAFSARRAGPGEVTPTALMFQLGIGVERRFLDPLKE